MKETTNDKLLDCSALSVVVTSRERDDDMVIELEWPDDGVHVVVLLLPSAEGESD